MFSSLKREEKKIKIRNVFNKASVYIELISQSEIPEVHCNYPDRNMKFNQFNLYNCILYFQLAHFI